MNNNFLKLISVLFAFLFTITLSASESKLSEILFETNFDNNYSVYITPLVKGEFRSLESKEVTLNADGVLVWNFDTNLSNWYQLTFMRVARDRQLGASFPIFVSKDKETIKISYSDTDYVTVLESDISNENKSLIQYSSFVNQMAMKRFMAGDVESEVTFDAQDYIKGADKLIEQNNVANADVAEYLKLLSYSSYIGAVLTNNVNGDISFPDNIFEVMNNEWIVSFYGGLNNLDRYIDYQVNGLKKRRMTLSDIESKIKLIDEKITHKSIKQNLLENNFEKFIRSYRIVDKDTYNKDKSVLENLVSSLDDAKLQKKIVNNFSNLLYTSVGSKVPDVKFKDTEGNEVSLDDFKGKYIYIDLWASWCAPCIVEIPHLRKLEERYKDKNIEFVSISIDFDKKAWMNKVNELELTGNQWEEGDSELSKIMNIAGVPHFLLYDSDGNLMMYNAPRPSSTQIITIFDEL